MTRVFPMEEWASAQGSQSTSPTSYAPGNDSFDTKDPKTPFRFRNRLRSLPLGHESEMVAGLHNMSLGGSAHLEDEKREGGIRGLIRKASISIKAKRTRRHSHAVSDGPRPSTSSGGLWLHKLRGAASFNKHSRPTNIDFGGPVDSCEELQSPIPGTGTEPPIIPRGSGGAAARATAAAQNEFFGRHRQLLTTEDQLEDRESGIGIALTTTEPMEYFDSSISRVDFLAELPIEIAIQILAHLDHNSLRATSAVSQSWNQVSGSYHVWREAFLREKTKTYAMSQPIKPGSGLGLPYYTENTDWKELYRVKQQLENNWREGKAEPIYLHGHLDSIYCVQFDE